MYVICMPLMTCSNTFIACIARDCKELYEKGHTCSGVYSIKPDKLPAFEVIQTIMFACI